MRSFRKADIALSEAHVTLKPKTGEYTRCIEDDVPSRKAELAEDAAEAGPKPKSEPEDATPRNQEPCDQGSDFPCPANPRSIELVCEVEVIGAAGAVMPISLSSGSISLGGQGLTLDLELALNERFGVSTSQSASPYSAPRPNLRDYPRQESCFNLDHDFTQGVSEDLGSNSPALSWEPTFRTANRAVHSAVPVAPRAKEPVSGFEPDAADPVETTPVEVSKSGKKKSLLGDLVFYVFLIALVLGAFFLSGGPGGGPKMLAGFSAFTVTTGSMHDVLPQGSLIITKHVEPEELQVGDDITYMISESSSITHRIIDIEENHEGSGQPAFQTQGTMNKNPDRNLVPAVNVVGKVVFCSYELGVAVNFIQDNWPLLIFLAAVSAVLFTVLRRILH